MIRRIEIAPRPNWQQRVSEEGLVFHTFESAPYWYESAYYQLSPELVSRFFEAAREVHAKCLELCEQIVDGGSCGESGLPPDIGDAITQSWRLKQPHLYGRFDFALGPDGLPKLLEYNADTPTALLEAAVIQDSWRAEVFPSSHAVGDIWVALVDRWSAIKGQLSEPLYFAYTELAEDLVTVGVLQQTATEAGLRTKLIKMEDIGYNAKRSAFTDLEENEIRTVFKLYPWEEMARERFGYFALNHIANTLWIEPVWKLLLSNKSILARLWRAFPEHPNLLPCFVGPHNNLAEWVAKPFFSREGANVRVHSQGLEASAEGEYGGEPVVYQAYCDMQCVPSVHTVFGVWMVGDEPCGIGIRESDGPITTNTSRFVPVVVCPV